jgi:hypothetical protein
MTLPLGFRASGAGICSFYKSYHTLLLDVAAWLTTPQHGPFQARIWRDEAI